MGFGFPAQSADGRLGVAGAGKDSVSRAFSRVAKHQTAFQFGPGVVVVLGPKKVVGKSVFTAGIGDGSVVWSQFVPMYSESAP